MTIDSQHSATTVPTARGIDEVLSYARRDLVRVSAPQALRELVDGSLLVDIRPIAQRRATGEIPGSLIIERNVLEWRLDPTSRARVPGVVSHDLRVIVLCQAGYASTLAAKSLQGIGLTRATDVIGGFNEWHRRGLPTVAGGTESERYVTGTLAAR